MPRLLAFEYDLIFIALAVWVVVLLSGAQSPLMGVFTLLAMPFYSLPILIVYFLLMNTVFGRTAGKMIMGIEIVTREGGKMGVLAALLRSILSAILVYFSCGILFLVSAFNKEKLAAHDFIMKTRVIHAGPKRKFATILGVLILIAAAVLFVVLWLGKR